MNSTSSNISPKLVVWLNYCDDYIPAPTLPYMQMKFKQVVCRNTEHDDKLGFMIKMSA